MVHPGLAALFAVGANLALLLGLRWAARREGKRAGLALARIPGAGDRRLGSR